MNTKSAQRIERYIKTLVFSQPSWLKNLFNQERIRFVVESDSMLSLELDIKLDIEVKDNAQRLIGAYIEKHPARFLKETDIFH